VKEDRIVWSETGLHLPWSRWQRLLMAMVAKNCILLQPLLRCCRGLQPAAVQVPGTHATKEEASQLLLVQEQEESLLVEQAKGVATHQRHLSLLVEQAKSVATHHRKSERTPFG
jgi:hypothetical protein